MTLTVTLEPLAAGCARLTATTLFETPSRRVHEFVKLVPGQMVAIDHVSPPRFRLIALFEAEGGGTRITWRQIFASKEDCEKVKGFAAPANEQNLDRLAAELAAMR